MLFRIAYQRHSSIIYSSQIFFGMKSLHRKSSLFSLLRNKFAFILFVSMAGLFSSEKGSSLCNTYFMNVADVMPYFNKN